MLSQSPSVAMALAGDLAATLRADAFVLRARARWRRAGLPRLPCRSPPPPAAKLFYDANALGGDSAELKGAQ